ncbi:MAG: hypothetical protein Q7R79_03215 [bacterium]|nr:hypothetical protein [bacterium]
MSHNTTTTDEIMDFLKENMVTREEFNELREDVNVLKEDVNVLKEDVQGLKKNMATRQELNEALGKLRSDFIDYMDKQLLDLKGDLVVIMKSEDRKLCALIELLVHKSILTASEAKTIVKLEPFPQAA